MEQILNFISEHSIGLVFGIIIFFGLIEGIFGYLAQSKRTKDDVFVETFSFFALIAFSKPVFAFIAFEIMQLVFPNQKDALMDLPFWLSLGIFLFVDDLSQYWYHRLAHEHKWLWKWHRPHHSATEMGILVSYREAIWYFMLIPSVWWFGIYAYLGGGLAMAFGLVIKQLVIVSSHSLATWDAPFYRNKLLLPIIKVIERIIITPAFHHGHHAVSIADGVGNPNGNFGNMFSIWDQIFGTAKFTHAFPKDYGIQNNPQESWLEHVFYPIIKSKNPKSELSADFKFEKTTQNAPLSITLEKGDYLYCQCGFSKNQPFCDGSHHGTKSQPLKFTIRKEMEYAICQCRLCEKGPFCDNSHLKIQNAAGTEG